ncbi:flagellar biosynthetic protein FliR [Thermodesulfobacterium sp. TA1]|uniref:flagellar biosynthetic protein FliR n=1 Tax=Thermodesulfobacterium sp. TA1 TaxID=2234087 RepID=UPI001231AC93|nr:flagellar biosynthetic protein FliR [Thermodesulfobacterium sp. TA1]QER42129.1 flagellar biosynthetic protein FliR [Thermodesulfobacterium sp. TA1]
MELLDLVEKQVFLFFLVFYRILLLFILFPVFGAVYFPTKSKIALSLVLGLALTPVVKGNIPFFYNAYQLFLLLISDFLFIFMISLVFRIILAGIQIGGELVGYQMGFGITQTIDPLSGFSLPVISQFVYIIFLFVFFVFDFHHYLISFVYYSFEKIPPGSFWLDTNLGLLIIKKSKLMFDLGIRFLAPLMVLMMLVYISLAIVGRLIPQINVMFISFPLTIGIGLIFLGLMLVLLPKILVPNIKDYFNTLNGVLLYFKQQ